MSTIDASIPLGVKPMQVENPANAMIRALQIQEMQQQREAGQLDMQDKATARERQNRLYGILAQEHASPEAREGALLKGGYVDQAAKLSKDRRDNAKTDAETQAKGIETAHKRMELMGQVLGWVRQNPTMENATAAVQHLVSNGAMPPEKAQEAIAKFQANPTPQAIAAFADMGFRAALAAKDQLPKIETRNLGGTTDTLSTDPVSGQSSVVNSVQNTQSPDNAATQATSRANNRDTINAENVRAGVMPGGGMDENSERTAQAIASGQLPAPTGMALLNPKNQRILGRVMEINPQYDASTVSAKKAAAAAFTSGKEGGMMRSLQVSGQHLDQLGQLADAMNNGNTQLVNKISNTLSQQTGNPAVTNFDGAKEIVAKEVMKSIVAGGGGVNEREELARSLSNAKSPAQLKGVIQQYRNLMAAQHDALLAQRDAAGLPRSTLPNYTEGGGGATPAAPAGWSVIGVQK